MECIDEDVDEDEEERARRAKQRARCARHRCHEAPPAAAVEAPVEPAVSPADSDSAAAPMEVEFTAAEERLANAGQSHRTRDRSVAPSEHAPKEMDASTHPASAEPEGVCTKANCTEASSRAAPDSARRRILVFIVGNEKQGSLGTGTVQPLELGEGCPSASDTWYGALHAAFLRDCVGKGWKGPFGSDRMLIWVLEGMLANRTLKDSLRCARSVRVVTPDALRQGGRRATSALRGATTLCDCVGADHADTTVTGIADAHEFAQEAGTSLERAFGGVACARSPGLDVLADAFLTKQYVPELSAAAASNQDQESAALRRYVPPSVGVRLAENLPADDVLYGAVAAAVGELVRHAEERGSPCGTVTGFILKTAFASTCQGVYISRGVGTDALADVDEVRKLTGWLRGALTGSGRRYLVVQQLVPRTTGEVRVFVAGGEPVHLVVTKPTGAAGGEDTDTSEVVLPPGDAADLANATLYTREEALEKGLLTTDAMEELREAVPLLLSRRGGLGAHAGRTPGGDWPWCRLDFLLVWRDDLRRYGVMFNEVETGQAGQYLHLAEHPVSALLGRAALVFAGVPAQAANAAAAHFLARHCPPALRAVHRDASAAAEAALLPGAHNPLR